MFENPCMSISNKQNRIKSLKKIIADCYTLLEQYEQKKLLTDPPKDKMRYELEVNGLKKDILEYEGELSEIENQLKNKKWPIIIKILIIGFGVIVLFSTLYLVYTSNDSKAESKIEADTLTTKNDIFITSEKKEPQKKILKAKLKTSVTPCDLKDFKSFPTGKVCLNIWFEKTTESKLKITWGDGEENTISSTSIDCYSASHTYTSKGEKEIVLYLIRSSNKAVKIASKTVTINSV